jgi:peptidyl-prolyl cis-trans isomerase B (cyclophilin B)
MQNFIWRLLVFFGLFTGINAQTLSKETVILETNYGTIKLKLFEETPAHKENFLKLAKDHVFDSLLFHRVIANFMIQAGDPLSKRANALDSLGDGDLGYTVKPEFNPNLIHLKGRLCAARESDDINPTQASSASQFYIVVGKKRTREDLQKYEDRINKAYYVKCAREFLKSEQGLYLKTTYNQMKVQNNLDSAQAINKRIDELVKLQYAKKPEFKFSQEVIEQYMSIGGTPHLDGTYTVFGEVVEGLDVVDKIALAKTGKKDRPIEDIRILKVIVQD